MNQNRVGKNIYVSPFVRKAEEIARMRAQKAKKLLRSQIVTSSMEWDSNIRSNGLFDPNLKKREIFPYAPKSMEEAKVVLEQTSTESKMENVPKRMTFATKTPPKHKFQRSAASPAAPLTSTSPSLSQTSFPATYNSSRTQHSRSPSTPPNFTPSRSPQAITGGEDDGIQVDECRGTMNSSIPSPTPTSPAATSPGAFKPPTPTSYVPSQRGLDGPACPPSPSSPHTKHHCTAFGGKVEVRNVEAVSRSTSPIDQRIVEMLIGAGMDGWGRGTARRSSTPSMGSPFDDDDDSASPARAPGPRPYRGPRVDAMVGEDSIVDTLGTWRDSIRPTQRSDEEGGRGGGCRGERGEREGRGGMGKPSGEPVAREVAASTDANAAILASTARLIEAVGGIVTSMSVRGGMGMGTTGAGKVGARGRGQGRGLPMRGPDYVSQDDINRLLQQHLAKLGPDPMGASAPASTLASMSGVDDIGDIRGDRRPPSAATRPLSSSAPVSKAPLSVAGSTDWVVGHRDTIQMSHHQPRQQEQQLHHHHHHQQQQQQISDAIVHREGVGQRPAVGGQISGDATTNEEMVGVDTPRSVSSSSSARSQPSHPSLGPQGSDGTVAPHLRPRVRNPDPSLQRLEGRRSGGQGVDEHPLEGAGLGGGPPVSPSAMIDLLMTKLQAMEANEAAARELLRRPRPRPSRAPQPSSTTTTMLPSSDLRDDDPHCDTSTGKGEGEVEGMTTIPGDVWRVHGSDGRANPHKVATVHPAQWHALAHKPGHAAALSRDPAWGHRSHSAQGGLEQAPEGVIFIPGAGSEGHLGGTGDVSGGGALCPPGLHLTHETALTAGALHVHTQQFQMSIGGGREEGMGRNRGPIVSATRRPSEYILPPHLAPAAGTAAGGGGVVEEVGAELLRSLSMGTLRDRNQPRPTTGGGGGGGVQAAPSVAARVARGSGVAKASGARPRALGLVKLVPPLDLEEEMNDYVRKLDRTRELRDLAFRSRGLTMSEVADRVAEAITSNCIASVGKEVEEFLQEYAEKFVDKI